MKNLQTIAELLDDFSINITTPMIIAERSDVFPKILGWHFKVWQKEEKNVKASSRYNAILMLLRSAISVFETITLKERTCFHFFDYLKKHVERYKDNYIVVDKAKLFYVGQLLNDFYAVFFEKITDSPARYDIWNHYFPSGWKITKTNLEDKINLIPRITYHEFSEWVVKRIWEPQGAFDKALEEVTKNIFPEVDPIMWAEILIFVYSPVNSANRVRFTIEQKWTFGFMGRMKGAYLLSDEAEVTKQQKAIEVDELKKTLELTLYLFGRHFSKMQLNDYIKEAESLKDKYGTNSIEEIKRTSLLGIFKRLLNFIDTPK